MSVCEYDGAILIFGLFDSYERLECWRYKDRFPIVRAFVSDREFTPDTLYISDLI